MTSDLKSLQVRMANLYMHQMQRGGIIDENADESNVISIQSENASEQVNKCFNKTSISLTVSILTDFVCVLILATAEIE